MPNFVMISDSVAPPKSNSSMRLLAGTAGRFSGSYPTFSAMAQISSRVHFEIFGRPLKALLTVILEAPHNSPMSLKLMRVMP